MKSEKKEYLAAAIRDLVEAAAAMGAAHQRHMDAAQEQEQVTQSVQEIVDEIGDLLNGKKKETLH